jgi:hypothetical protein
VQRPLTSGPRGGRLANFYVSSDQNVVDTCLHEKGKDKAVKKVGGGRTHWPASHIAWPPGHHLVSYHLDQVGGAPPRPYKYHPPYRWKSEHTPYFGDSTCKALILSVVARRSLVRRVVRLRGPEDLPACREPSS